jgi:hypothetical protein
MHHGHRIAAWCGPLAFRRQTYGVPDVAVDKTPFNFIATRGFNQTSTGVDRTSLFFRLAYMLGILLRCPPL